LALFGGGAIVARARNIKPGFYKNEDLAECSVWARLIFPGLWMLADREGRLEDRPKRIKGELLPFDAQEVEPLLAELAAKYDAQGVPFIVRYENSDGRFIQISKFSANQTPHYSEKRSVIKPPPLQEPGLFDDMQIPGIGVHGDHRTPGIGVGNGSSGNDDDHLIPGKHGSSRGGRNPLTPDSLTPDSGLLTPDSPNPDSPTAAAAAALPSPKRPSSEQAHGPPPQQPPSTYPPDDFEVTTAMEQWAKTEAPNADVSRETAKFRDHEFAHTPGSWTAKWRTWMRTASDGTSHKQPARSGETPYERAQREKVELATGGRVSAPRPR
jgi:hypothetical protein